MLAMPTKSARTWASANDTGVAVEHLAGLYKTQIVARSLTEVKCVEAGDNKHSVGPQIISSQTILHYGVQL